MCNQPPKSPDFLALFVPRAVGRTADLTPGRPDEISIIYLIFSSHHHHTPFTPTPSLSFPSRFSEVSGDSGPCYLAPPFLHGGGEEKRGRKKGRLQPTTTMSPGAPSLPAPPAAHYSCGSVPDPDQLGSQPRRRATRGATVCVKAPCLSRCLVIR